jgi:benzoyl-CoA reductase subunit B
LSTQLWETRPLEIWGKAKELRAKWQRSINESAEQPGYLLAHGNSGEVEWATGFTNNLNIAEDNPVGAMMASKDDAFTRKVRLASEIRGWGREICGYVQNCWGCQFLGYDAPDGNLFPFRDMSVPFPDPCDQHLKRGQQCMDLLPIPRWGSDCPMYLGPIDPERDKALIDHKVYCTMHVINEIEKDFGIEFNTEDFFCSMFLRAKMEDYGMEIARLMTHTPAPIGQKELYSFYTLGSLAKVDPNELIDFWSTFVNEVQWRVDNNIAAVANERYR